MPPSTLPSPLVGVLFGLTAPDWFFVGLASAIIFGIIGPKLWRDIQAWRR